MSSKQSFTKYEDHERFANREARGSTLNDRAATYCTVHTVYQSVNYAYIYLYFDFPNIIKLVVLSLKKEDIGC